MQADSWESTKVAQVYQNTTHKPPSSEYKFGSDVKEKVYLKFFIQNYAAPNKSVVFRVILKGSPERAVAENGVEITQHWPHANASFLRL